jgi:hypothetical protein
MKTLCPPAAAEYAHPSDANPGQFILGNADLDSPCGAHPAARHLRLDRLGTSAVTWVDSLRTSLAWAVSAQSVAEACGEGRLVEDEEFACGSVQVTINPTEDSPAFADRPFLMTRLEPDSGLDSPPIAKAKR